MKKKNCKCSVTILFNKTSVKLLPSNFSRVLFGTMYWFNTSITESISIQTTGMYGEDETDVQEQKKMLNLHSSYQTYNNHAL